MPPDIQAIGQSIGDLQASKQATRATTVGDRIALPALSDIDGATVDLASVVGAQPIVLIFYRGGWCPYCNVTLRAYAKALSDISAAGGALFAVTPELAENASKTRTSNAIGFPILIDRGNDFARSLGLVFALPADRPASIGAANL